VDEEQFTESLMDEAYEELRTAVRCCLLHKAPCANLFRLSTRVSNLSDARREFSRVAGQVAPIS